MVYLSNLLKYKRHLDLESQRPETIWVEIKFPSHNILICCLYISNLRFADDIDALAEEEQELEALVESLDKTCTRYKMEISAEKTKLMTNSANGIQREIKVKEQKLGTVTSFKYLGGWLQTRASLKDCQSHCSSYKAETHLER